MTASSATSDASESGMDANSIIESINATVNARFTLYEPRNSPLELSNLCSSCKNIFDSECPSPGISDFLDERQDGEVLHHSLEELSAHAVRGCHLCLTVYLTIDPDVLGEFQHYLEEIREGRSWNSDSPTNLGFAMVDPIARDQARVIFRWVTTPVNLRAARARKALRESAGSDSNFTMESDDYDDESDVNEQARTLQAELILMNPRYAVEPGVHTISAKSTNTASPESFETAKRWIEDCSFNHMKCSANEGAGPIWKPTHLLDVTVHDGNGIPGVKLVDGQFLDPLTEYCTLSHCWGIGNDPDRCPIRLHKGTLSALRQGVAGTNLPRTFADAALATTKLGYNYLWIDALCIMHDNEKEVQKEIANMHRVYSEATLNISATSSRDDTAGLFRNRNAAGLRPVVVEVTDGLGVYEGRYKILRSTTWEDLIDSSPLCKRAWVFQERALCKRTLHFTRNELLWECQQMCCSEVFPKGLPMTMSALAAAQQQQESRRETIDSIEAALTERPQKRIIEKFNKRTHHQRTGNWYSIIEQYTAGKLTYATDKLPAIAGLARQYLLRNRGLRPTDYFAGMWKQQLPHSLLWNAEDGGRRPAKYRAPTWSWASVEGQITYPDFRSASGVGSKQTCLEIISIDARTRNDDPFGQCDSAKLKVRGFLGKGRVELAQECTGGRCGFKLLCEEGSTTSPPHIAFEFACFDETLHKPRTSSLALLRQQQSPTPANGAADSNSNNNNNNTNKKESGDDSSSRNTPVTPAPETVVIYLLPVVDVHDQVSGLILTPTVIKGEFKRVGSFDISSLSSSSMMMTTAIAGREEKRDKDKENWDRFRTLMKGNLNIEHYEERIDHTDDPATASDYTYTITLV